MDLLGKVFCVIFFTISLSTNIQGDDEKYAYHFDRIESINGTGEYFKYDVDIKKQEGSDTIFIVQANIDQLIELNDDWKSDITVFRADSADGEFTKFLKFPRVGVCMFLKTMYKKYFYDTIKDYSNLPHYDKCPLNKEKYWVKDFPFDADKFKSMAKPGFYRVEGFIINDSVAKTGFHMFGSVTAQ